MLTQRTKNLPKEIQGLVTDIEILKAIKDREIPTKTFDFDGQKYKSEKARSIREMLEIELQEKKNALANADKNIFIFFYKKALKISANEAKFYTENYKAYFTHRKEADQYLNRK